MPDTVNTSPSAMANPSPSAMANPSTSGTANTSIPATANPSRTGGDNGPEFQVHILSAERNFYEGPCVSLVLPTIDGERGILARHASMVTAVVPGELRCELPDGSVLTAAVSHGLLRVENNDALVLVDSAERPDEIDVARARRAAEQAREELLHKQSWQEYLQTQANLTRAMNRLKAASRNG